MTATTRGTAKLVLEIIEYINGCTTDEEAIGACQVLIDFIKDVREQRSRVYWEVMDWGEIKNG